MSAKPSKNRNYRRSRLVLTFAGVLLLGGLLFSVFTLPARGQSEKLPGDKPGQSTRPSGSPTGTVPDPSSTSTPTPTPSPTPTPTPVEPFVKNEDEEITELVKAYCNAKLEGEIEAFEPYVSNTENLNVAYYKKQYSLVKSTDNYEIYTVSGKYGLKYIAFVVYDLEITAIDTPSLEATLLQIVESEPDEEGNTHLVICTDVLTDEQREFQNQIQTHEDFIKLYMDFWQKDFEKVQENLSYAKLWYNLFSEGISTFSSKYETVEAFVDYIKNEATLEDFLAMKTSLHSDYSDDEYSERPEDGSKD